MYIDRIRINWDKNPEDSYLNRIGSICLLQELQDYRDVHQSSGNDGEDSSERVTHSMPTTELRFSTIDDIRQNY